MVDGTAGSTLGYPGDWTCELHALLEGLELRALPGPDEPGDGEPWMREALGAANDNDASEHDAGPGGAGLR